MTEPPFSAALFSSSTPARLTNAGFFVPCRVATALCAVRHRLPHQPGRPLRDKFTPATRRAAGAWLQLPALRPDRQTVSPSHRAVRLNAGAWCLAASGRTSRPPAAASQPPVVASRLPVVATQPPVAASRPSDGTALSPGGSARSSGHTTRPSGRTHFPAKNTPKPQKHAEKPKN
jgi:hypothetical protein